MAEIIKCPECGRTLQVPETFFGQKVQCPECAHQFVADPYAQNVQSTPPSTAPAAPPAETDADDRPRSRRREYDSSYDDDFDDDIATRRPSRRHSGYPHRGGLILTLGLIALIGGMSIYLPFVIGPIAWLMGNSDLAEIHAGRMDPSGEGLVQAGRILGIISTVFLILGVVIVCGFVGLIMLAHR